MLPMRKLRLALPVPLRAPPTSSRNSTLAARVVEKADDVVLGALVVELGDDVAGLVDEIAVVAVAAAHLVGAGQAVQRVVIGGAGEGVVGGSSSHDGHCALHSCNAAAKERRARAEVAAPSAHEAVPGKRLGLRDCPLAGRVRPVRPILL